MANGDLTALRGYLFATNIPACQIFDDLIAERDDLAARLADLTEQLRLANIDSWNQAADLAAAEAERDSHILGEEALLGCFHDLEEENARIFAKMVEWVEYGVGRPDIDAFVREHRPFLTLPPAKKDSHG